MKMRELEARSGVHRETIRVYLRHKLIPEPRRPQRNVADYDEEHLQAVLAVRRLQVEGRLTLPQIGAMLGGDMSSRLGADSFTQLEQLVAARVGLDGHLVPIASLNEQYPQALRDARAFSRIGIVRLLDTPEGEALSLTDAELVSLWGEMRHAGFVERLDFRPKMLDFYIEAAEFVGSWEARTFLDRTEGTVDEDIAAAMVERALPLMLNFFGLLRRKVFLRAISEGRAEPHRLPRPNEVGRATS